MARSGQSEIHETPVKVQQSKGDGARRVVIGQAGRNPNRTQLLVLGLFICVWVGLVAILVSSPDIYAQTLRLAPEGGRTIEIMFFAALSALIVLRGLAFSDAGDGSSG
jgi:hypothetical protein